MDSKPHLRINTKFHIYSWIFIFGSLLILKYFDILFFRSVSILPVYWLYWFYLMFVRLYEGDKLYCYLEKNHPDYWKKMTHADYESSGIKFYGSGMNLRRIDFLISKEPAGDKTLDDLKKNYVRLIIFMLALFFLFPVIMILGWYCDGMP